MLHLVPEDAPKDLQQFAKCGVGGAGFLMLPNGAMFDWPRCSKCFKGNTKVDKLATSSKRRRL